MAGDEGIGEALDTRRLGRGGIVTIDVCPACGYPTVGPDLCFYCRPVEMLTRDRTFEPTHSASKLRHGSVSVGIRQAK
jgi:hypothetical protein